jgi:hypothetical protein
LRIGCGPFKRAVEHAALIDRVIDAVVGGSG